MIHAPHFHWPRFNVHPLIGLVDLMVIVGSLTAMFGSFLADVVRPLIDLSQVDHALGTITGLLIGGGGIYLKIREQSLKDQNVKIDQLMEESAKSIKERKDLLDEQTRFKEAIKKGEEDRDKLKEENKRIAAESEERHKRIKEQAEKAVADAKSEAVALAAKEVERVIAENAVLKEELKRAVKHEVASAVNVVALDLAEKQRNLTPDPDRILKTVIVNDPTHPVPTLPQAGGNP